MRIWLLIFLGSFFCPVYGQFFDNFLDGDLTQNPPWSGDLQFFTIESGKLRTNGPSETATLTLTTPSNMVEDVEWSFWIRLGFNPSNNNQSRIFLMADRTDLDDPNLNGYYIRIGETGNDDGVDLYRRHNGLDVRILSGPIGDVAFSFEMRIKVIRKSGGIWALWCDLSGGTEYNTYIGEVVDNTIDQASYFGLWCRHTSSNNQNFYFDEIYAGTIIPDNSGPEITEVRTESNSILKVIFARPLVGAVAEDPNQYFISGGVGVPLTATLEPIRMREVTLHLAAPLQNGQEYVLNVLEASALNGNTILNQEFSFSYFEIAVGSYKEVLVHEIMTNPTPAIGLPDTEYIELYNRSNQHFNLEGWTFNGVDLIYHILSPGGYVIICPAPRSAEMQAFGPVVGINSWPGLTNSGGTITIRNQNQTLIDFVAYTDRWYRNNQKQSGGWSLEMISTGRACDSSENWKASESAFGGTPGKVNSISQEQPGLVGPKLKAAIAKDIQTIRLDFNKSLWPDAAQDAQITISPQVDIAGKILEEPGRNKMELFLNQPLDQGQVYELEVKLVRDCNKNLISGNDGMALLALPKNPDTLDVVINELLFNAHTGGEKFVEIYNRSNGFIDLKDWRLANEVDGVPANFRQIQDDHLILQPGKILAITPGIDAVIGDYPRAAQDRLFEISTLPSYPISSGIVILASPDRIIDRFEYDESMHHPAIRERRGISLERISTEAPTKQKSNWHSAASEAGYATPGYQNSQSRNFSAIRGTVELNPEVILPDNSGFQDFTTISYQMPQSGFLGSIKIIDRTGRPIKSIAENAVLSIEGFFVWDGTDDQGRRAPPGRYVLWMEVLHLDGTVQTFRKRVAVGTHF